MTVEAHDISSVKYLRLSISVVALLLLAGGTALAQNPNNMVGGSPFNPPPPPPPPSPSLAVPVVPKMDVPSPQYSNGTYGYNNGAASNHGSSRRHSSFHKRVSRCLAEATAGGFGPGDRDFYVRSCVNR